MVAGGKKSSGLEFWSNSEARLKNRNRRHYIRPPDSQDFPPMTQKMDKKCTIFSSLHDQSWYNTPPNH